MELFEKIKERARKDIQRIVLPESYEPRTLKAADIAIDEKIAEIILIGNKDELFKKAKELSLKNFDKFKIIDNKTSEKREEYSNLMVEIRKSKGLTFDEALKLLDNPLYYSVMMIKSGDADGEVAGADNATSEVLRPALQFIKTTPGIKVVSGCFIMVVPDKNFGENGILIFADCGVTPDPTSEELVDIALASAMTLHDIVVAEPRIAMLSFSTKGSAKHPNVDKVVKATQILKEQHPELKVDGELQADAALVKSVAEKKCPGSEVAGNANILIFPNLDAGNIGYKLVQRLAHAEAIGPILQGIAAPVNDLSRGCSIDDIIITIAVTANQAIGRKSK